MCHIDVVYNSNALMQTAGEVSSVLKRKEGVCLILGLCNVKQVNLKDGIFEVVAKLEEGGCIIMLHQLICHY